VKGTELIPNLIIIARANHDRTKITRHHVITPTHNLRDPILIQLLLAIVLLLHHVRAKAIHPHGVLHPDQVAVIHLHEVHLQVQAEVPLRGQVEVLLQDQAAVLPQGRVDAGNKRFLLKQSSLNYLQTLPVRIR
jgi:hypothetical protein